MIAEEFDCRYCTERGREVPNKAKGPDLPCEEDNICRAMALSLAGRILLDHHKRITPRGFLPPKGFPMVVSDPGELSRPKQPRNEFIQANLDEKREKPLINPEPRPTVEDMQAFLGPEENRSAILRYAQEQAAARSREWMDFLSTQPTIDPASIPRFGGLIEPSPRDWIKEPAEPEGPHPDDDLIRRPLHWGDEPGYGKPKPGESDNDA